MRDRTRDARTGSGRMRTAAVGVAVALLATACGGGDGGEEVADAADAATETTATEVTTTEVATTETTAVPEPTATPEMAEGGAIEITAAIVFGESAGSFQISEGSDVLGCAMGTFEEAPLAATIERTFTCDMGERACSFVLHFFPEPTADPTEFASDWTVEDATWDFAGLTGEGGFAALVDEDESGAAETWTGEVTFGAPSEEESDALAFDGVIDVAYLDAVLETQRIDDGVGTVQLSVFGDDGGVTTAVAGTDEAGSSPTGSTPYRVGSITKVFTSIATLSLVADGSITLGTLAVNVAGSFVLARLVATGSDLLTVVGTGGLGALTTWSAVAVAAVTPDHPPGRRAAVFVAAVGLPVAAAWIGLALGCARARRCGPSGWAGTRSVRVSCWVSWCRCRFVRASGRVCVRGVGGRGGRRSPDRWWSIGVRGGIGGGGGRGG